MLGSWFQLFQSTVKENCNSETTYVWNLIWPLLPHSLDQEALWLEITCCGPERGWLLFSSPTDRASERGGGGLKIVISWLHWSGGRASLTWVHLQVRKRNKVSGGWPHQLRWIPCEQSFTEVSIYSLTVVQRLNWSVLVSSKFEFSICFQVSIPRTQFSPKCNAAFLPRYKTYVNSANSLRKVRHPSTFFHLFNGCY